MQRYRLLDTRCFGRLMEQARQLTGGQRPAGSAAWEKPALLQRHAIIVARGPRLPPLPQQIQHLGRQHHMTVLAPHDNRLVPELIDGLEPKTMLLADRGCDADWIRGLIWNRGGWANIPPKRHRKDPVNFSPYLYKDRNLIEPSSTRSSTFAASPPAMTSSPDARLSAPAR